MTNNKSKIIINRTNTFKTSLNVEDFCYRSENFINNLLHPANPDNDKVCKYFSEGSGNQLLTILYDFKQQQVAPGTFIVYSKSHFYDEITQYAKQNSKVDTVFKKYNLYDPEILYQSINCVLYFLDVLPDIDACSGISICQNAIIMYRDMTPDPENPDLSQVEIDEDYEYDENDDDRLWFLEKFDDAISEFIKDTTKEWITIMSEDDFFKKFKEYLKFAKRKYDFDYFMGSITNFYEHICDRRGLINYWTPLYWSIGSGYVVLINDDCNNVE